MFSLEMKRLFLILLASIALVSGTGVETLLIDAVARYNEGNYSGARDILLPLAAKVPDNDAVCYYLGLCELYLGEMTEAETHLAEAARLDPHNFWYKERLARLYSATGRPELTVSIFEQLIEDFPDKTDVYYSLAGLYAQMGKTDKVLETLDEIETIFGKSETVTLYRYDVLMQQQRPDEAYKALEEFNKEYLSAQVLSAMGDYNLSQYEDTLALGFYNEALDLEPDCAPAMVGKAEVSRIRRNFPEYFSSIQKVIESENFAKEMKTKYLTSVIGRSDPRFVQTFRSQFDTLIEALVASAPSDSTILQTAGGYYYSTDRKDKAEEYVVRDKDLHPESLGSRAAYIQLLAGSEKWEKVAAESEKAYADFPQEKAFLEYRALALFNLEDYKEFIKVNERLVASCPGDTAVARRSYSSIGDAYYKLNDSKKAYSYFDKALKIDPNDILVLNNYAYYLCLEGKKLKKAYAMSKKTIEAEPDNATYLDTFGWILHLMGRDVEAKPFFKHAMIYGGRDQATLLDHYAEVLYALKEYDLAKGYWNMAKSKNVNGEIPDLDERVEARLKAIAK